MKLIFTLLILVVSLQMGAAQILYFTDSLQLQDGSWRTGRVNHFTQGGKVTLENVRGFVQSYRMKDIRQLMVHLPDNQQEKAIKSKDRPGKERCEKPYAFREHGFYGITYAGTINGIGYNSEMQIGLSLQQVTGFQWNRMLGAGIGVGVENFSVGNANGPLVLPVYAEARGYFLQKNTTPLNVGYGFAFKDEDQRILKAQGGWLVHPAIGFRMGARDGVNFLFDVGYKFQHLTLTRDFTQGSRDYQVQNLLYKRFSVRLGLIF